jgi:hypothetical protein
LLSSYFLAFSASSFALVDFSFASFASFTSFYAFKASYSAILAFSAISFDLYKAFTSASFAASIAFY